MTAETRPNPLAFMESHRVWSDAEITAAQAQGKHYIKRLLQIVALMVITIALDVFGLMGGAWVLLPLAFLCFAGMRADAKASKHLTRSSALLDAQIRLLRQHPEFVEKWGLGTPQDAAAE